MKITKRETTYCGKYLRLIYKHFRTARGHTGIWEMVERTNIFNNGAVVVIPVTKNKELILERHWRIPLESSVIQFPAGLSDREGESEEETARRELLEETGYKANELIPIIITPECSVLTSTEVNHFFAPDVEYVGMQRADTAEEIEVVKIPIHQTSDFLLNLPEGTRLDLRVPGILWIMEKAKFI